MLAEKAQRSDDRAQKEAQKEAQRSDDRAQRQFVILVTLSVLVDLLVVLCARSDSIAMRILSNWFPPAVHHL